MNERKERMTENSCISWNLNDDGVMTVEGTGKIGDCSCGTNPPAPWEDVKDRILELFLMDGITEVGINAFRDCVNLERVVLSHSVKRIHAYAFWNCRSLVRLESGRPDFQYVSDDRKYNEDRTVIFGLEAFHGVPWGRDRWDGFYVREDRLYVCFPGDSGELRIPEGVRVLNTFAVHHQQADALMLPKTLEVIEDFAFSGTEIRNAVTLPESVKELSCYALADCSVFWEDTPVLKEMIRRNRKLDADTRKRLPSSFRQYSLALRGRKEYGPFKKIEIRENHPPGKPDGQLQSFVINRTMNVGENVYRKIRKGNTVLCVTCEEGRISSVKSFIWEQSDLVLEYQMYPVLYGEENLQIWEDAFLLQNREEIVRAFPDTDIRLLKERGALRKTCPDRYEEWFWSGERGNAGGPLELAFLKKWLSLHPGTAVDTEEENERKQKYRLLTDV